MHGGHWSGKFPTLAFNEAISISRLSAVWQATGIE